MQSSERVQCCVRCVVQVICPMVGAWKRYTSDFGPHDMAWRPHYGYSGGGMQLCEFRVKHACAFSVWRILFFCAGNWRISRKLIEFGLVHMQGMDVSRKTILIWTLCSKSRFLGIKTNCLRFFGCMFSVAGNTQATKRRNDNLQSWSGTRNTSQIRGIAIHEISLWSNVWLTGFFLYDDLFYYLDDTF